MDNQTDNTPFPIEMQGHWTETDNPAGELIILGSEIVCFGKRILYDYKIVGTDEGALTVSLKVNDPSAEDTFQRANITELVLSPEGELHAYNVKFASQFERRSV